MKNSVMSFKRHGILLSRYSDSPERYARRVTATSVSAAYGSGSWLPSSASSTRETSAIPAAGLDSLPAEMRSSALLPRSRVGACSPSTHRIASTTFDLPNPLGPTTAVIPGAKPIVVESRKDLKPNNSRLLRRMLPPPPPHHHLPKAYPKVRWEGQEHPLHIVCRRTGTPSKLWISPVGTGRHPLARDAGT